MPLFKSSNTLHSPKYIEKRRKKIFSIILLAFFLIAALSVSTILFFRSPYVEISSVNVEGSSLVSKDEIVSNVMSSLSGSYMHLIPFTNIFFVPKDNIRESLSDKFSEIKNFSIRRTGLKEITISLEERIPSAIACSGFREDPTTENCYFSDNNGYIFKEISTSTRSAGEKYNLYYIPTDKGEVTTGQNFIEEKRFRELENFLSGVIKGGLNPLGLLIGEDGEYEMYVENITGENEATVYFDDKLSFDNTLSNLLTFWESTVKKGTRNLETPFEYINLRFGNTIYYSTQ